MRVIPAFFLLVSTLAYASEVPPEHEAQAKKVLDTLSYYTGATKDACGLEPTIDWASFIKAERINGPGSTIASACQGGLQGLAETCGTDKAKITSKIESVVCVHVPDKKATGLVVEGKTLSIRVHILDTGAGSAPTSMMAPNRTDALTWFEKKL